MTGESALVEKDIAPVSLQTPLAERSSMIYLGTSIARGRALAVIVNTGTSTETRPYRKACLSFNQGTIPT
jgi:Ca2+-transporting ATPase